MGEKIDARIPTSFFEILILFLSIKGKINFLQLERFSEKCKQSFRYIFERPFNFLSFNKALTKLRWYDPEKEMLVCINNKCGFVDDIFRPLTELKYKDALPYNLGFSLVETPDGKWGYIDRQGREYWR